MTGLTVGGGGQIGGTLGAARLKAGRCAGLRLGGREVADDVDAATLLWLRLGRRLALKLLANRGEH